MKTKQTLLVMMTALFCAFGAGQLWAATAIEKSHLDNNVRIVSITKSVPKNTNKDKPVGTEIYFDVKLDDASDLWIITGNTYDSTASAQCPYLLLDMPLKGASTKPATTGDVEATEETETAVAYYVGQGATTDTLRFTYVVRPGDMSTAITWETTEDGYPAIVNIAGIKLSATDIAKGPISGGVNLTDAVAAVGITDTADPIAVSGYTFTVGDTDNNNMGMMYAGLVPVTVTTIKPETGTRTTLDSTLYNKVYFWAEDANGNQYHNVGVTTLTTGAEIIKEGDYGTPTSATFPEVAAKVSGLNKPAFTQQKFMVSVPAKLVNQTIRLCYGVKRDSGVTEKTYAYATYTVGPSPILNLDAQTGYTVNSTEMSSLSEKLPGKGLKYTNLQNATVNGGLGLLELGAGETSTLKIRLTNGAALVDYGTLYASIELISTTNAANTTPERYYVPLDGNGVCLVKFAVDAMHATADATSYYRVRVPALEDANGVGTVEKPYYIKVVASPKRETIYINSTEKTGVLGTEYYSPADPTAGTTPGSYTVLEYTLSVPVSDSDRYFLIHPVDANGERIDDTVVIKTETKADGDNAAGTEADNTKDIKVLDIIKSVATLQPQGGAPMSNALTELKVLVRAGETTATFYVACRNDYALNKGLLSGDATKRTKKEGSDEPDESPITLGGVIYAARTCNSKSVITGTLDDCVTVAYPQVQNRAPSILTMPPTSQSQAVNTKITFPFSVADATSDYLVLIMNYGDGTSEAVLMADETKMEAIMGKTAWDAEKTALKTAYGINTTKTADNIEKIDVSPRTTDTGSYDFTHAYTAGETVQWTFTVIDSSKAQVSTEGTVNLQSAQTFTFDTIYGQTKPASGYVLWDNGTAADKQEWTFGSNRTFNSLPKSGATNVAVKAYPYAAGDTKPTNFEGPSETHDSFFYKWSARPEYAALLPAGDEALRCYESVLSFSRAFVTGEAEAQDASKWQDIQLSAIFVAEYRPGDAITNVPADPLVKYLYDLGDYNQDGVPDGWMLKVMGEDNRATLVEGANAANGSPDGAESIPDAGWGSGNAAYDFSNADRSNRLPSFVGEGGPCAMTGVAPFGYKTRVRGLDEALNAADGNGNWLSHPAWVVLMHDEKEIEIEGVKEKIILVGEKLETGIKPAWKQVRLLNKSTKADKDIAFTPANKIPYSKLDMDGDWAYVLDAEGKPIKGVNNMMVCTNPDSPDYEAFRYTYTAKWAVKDGDKYDMAVAAGASFPYETVAEADAAKAGKDIDNYGGKDYNGVYCFIEERAIAGMLLDEVFGEVKNADEYIDPRLTSWLDRFGIANDDTDGDGIKNGAEYYFWYYASRIAYASTFVATKKDGDKDVIVGVQINHDLWPAIDMRKRTAQNTDGAYGLTETFVMGRRFKADYDPDSLTAGYYDENFEEHGGDASRGKGNYWEPIPVEDVMAVFNPFAAANRASDVDGDGLADVEEFAIGTNPLDCDTDDDWIPDNWEVQHDMDPFNLRGLNDAELNPDNDVFAFTPVDLYSDYHHLFKMTLTKVVQEEGGTERDEVVTAYYDYEDKVVRIFDKDIETDVLARKFVDLEDGAEELSLEKAKAEYTKSIVWENVDPIFLEMEPKRKLLRDFQVYRTFGFNARTATPLQRATNTRPFVSREEFNSGITRGEDLDPNNADTDGDGLPDGWALYVNLHAMPPPGHAPADGDRDLDGDGLTCAQEYAYGATTGWTNKTMPTDPWNPDTDFDGLWDGMEGQRYIYGTPIAGTSSYIAGGGCDPNNPDTDNDGMGDAWEYTYGAEPVMGVPAVEEGVEVAETEADEEAETLTYVLNGVTLTYTEAPDPTRSGADDNMKRMSDFDLDADGDGLTNIQECMTAMMRQYRYDLDPDMARIYKGDEGELQEIEEKLAEDTEEWLTLPNLFSPVEDLAVPMAAISTEVKNGEIPSILAQSIANLDWVVDKEREQQVGAGNAKTNYAEAIHAALDAQWNSTMAFPTVKQLNDYNLLDIDPEKLGQKFGLLDTEMAIKEANRLINTLTELAFAFTELDAVWQRCVRTEAVLTNNSAPLTGMVKNEFINILDNSNDSMARNERQFRAVIAKIDALLAVAQKDAALGKYQPVICELLKKNGETETIWAARKQQLLKCFVGTLFNRVPTAATDYVYGMIKSDDLAGANFTCPRELAEANELIAANQTNINAYEIAVWNAKNPLIQNRYRAAMRGFEGAYLANSNVFGLIGWHAMIKPFAVRKNTEFVLGVPLTDGLGANDYPGWEGPKKKLFTTSPLSEDTDIDGMDDYFEVFHGLNPVLGDYINVAWEDVSRDYSGVDRVGAARKGVSNVENALAYATVTPTVNAFNAPIFGRDNATGFDYYTYPWLAGTPFADPDGDGLLNFEEAVNPVTAAPQHYGTDPSPLWMTDPTNPNSFVSRFYTRKSGMTWPGAGDTEMVPMVGDSIFAYEMNEGYDTDGDGISDAVELTSNSILRGDPQSLATPDRSQAAYFGGEGALQSMLETQFGPQALTTFTVECWVKPEEQATNEVILIDRPWRLDEEGAFHHNFVIGLRQVTPTTYRVFAYYTGAGTIAEAGSLLQVSPEVATEETIKVGEWNHVAVSYDGAENGARLALYLNGLEVSTQTCGLIPANGVLSVRSAPDNDVRRFTYAQAPIIIGAGPAKTWKADLSEDPDAAVKPVLAHYFANNFKGFIDEVRIWNGARTADQIADARDRVLTQQELLTFRTKAITSRYTGNGYFEAKVPAYPLAIYSFNDLLAGAAEDLDNAWETYPGEKVTGDATVAGSFLYRRKGFQETLDDIQNLDPVTDAYNYLAKVELPTEKELFTSYYTTKVAAKLRSTKYATDEVVPLARNTMEHLPLVDVERDYLNRYEAKKLKDGSPKLKFPSKSVEHLKVANSFFWSPYHAGVEYSTTPIYSVNTAGNPYAYIYHGTIFFDALNYIAQPAFVEQTPVNLLVLGDVFAKYDTEMWDVAPSTDPSIVNKAPVAEGADWFRHKEDGKDPTLNGKQYSNGADYLESTVSNGQTKDTDGDRMPNWWENHYGLDATGNTDKDGPHGDPDGDFLTNYAEYLAPSNPLKFSTAGNGEPDAQIPIWFRRGAPTFAMLYTDNDFMEDHWEASKDYLSVDLHDGQNDADGDGWSNFAEARANFRSGIHSTNPTVSTSLSQTGEIVKEFPTPMFRMTVDYFGTQQIYGGAAAGEGEAAAAPALYVHAYTVKGNNGTPDATYKLSFATEATEGKHEVGMWSRVPRTGYIHGGNIVPGSLKITYTKMGLDVVEQDALPEGQHVYFTLLSDPAVVNGNSQLYLVGEGLTEEGVLASYRIPAGTINYITGEYSLDFSDEEAFKDYVVLTGRTLENGLVVPDTYYACTEFVGVATYQTVVVAGNSNTFTIVEPEKDGHLEEGINNFFVFADVNGNGKWDEGEPAGVPDQRDVDIGFDRVNETLHVTLTDIAPPGAVRLDLAARTAPAENAEGEEGEAETTTTVFDSSVRHHLVLEQFEQLPTPDFSEDATITINGALSARVNNDEVTGDNDVTLNGAVSYRTHTDEMNVTGKVDYREATLVNDKDELIVSGDVSYREDAELAGTEDLTVNGNIAYQVEDATAKNNVSGSLFYRSNGADGTNGKITVSGQATYRKAGQPEVEVPYSVTPTTLSKMALTNGTPVWAFPLPNTTGMLGNLYLFALVVEGSDFDPTTLLKPAILASGNTLVDLSNEVNQSNRGVTVEMTYDAKYGTQVGKVISSALTAQNPTAETLYTWNITVGATSLVEKAYADQALTPKAMLLSNGVTVWAVELPGAKSNTHGSLYLFTEGTEFDPTKALRPAILDEETGHLLDLTDAKIQETELVGATYALSGNVHTGSVTFRYLEIEDSIYPVPDEEEEEVQPEIDPETGEEIIPEEEEEEEVEPTPNETLTTTFEWSLSFGKYTTKTEYLVDKAWTPSVETLSNGVQVMAVATDVKHDIYGTLYFFIEDTEKAFDTFTALKPAVLNKDTGRLMDLTDAAVQAELGLTATYSLAGNIHSGKVTVVGGDAEGEEGADVDATLATIFDWTFAFGKFITNTESKDWAVAREELVLSDGVKVQAVKVAEKGPLGALYLFSEGEFDSMLALKPAVVNESGRLMDLTDAAVQAELGITTTYSILGNVHTGSVMFVADAAEGEEGETTATHVTLAKAYDWSLAFGTFTVKSEDVAGTWKEEALFLSNGVAVQAVKVYGSFYLFTEGETFDATHGLKPAVMNDAGRLMDLSDGTILAQLGLAATYNLSGNIHTGSVTIAGGVAEGEEGEEGEAAGTTNETLSKVLEWKLSFGVYTTETTTLKNVKFTPEVMTLSNGVKVTAIKLVEAGVYDALYLFEVGTDVADFGLSTNLKPAKWDEATQRLIDLTDEANWTEDGFEATWSIAGNLHEGTLVIRPATAGDAGDAEGEEGEVDTEDDTLTMLYTWEFTMGSEQMKVEEFTNVAITLVDMILVDGTVVKAMPLPEVKGCLAGQLYLFTVGTEFDGATALKPAILDATGTRLVDLSTDAAELGVTVTYDLEGSMHVGSITVGGAVEGEEGAEGVELPGFTLSTVYAWNVTLGEQLEIVYNKFVSLSKLYFTENDVFTALPEGLPVVIQKAGTESIASTYKAYLVPESKANKKDETWETYAIGVVTNTHGQMDETCTAMISPVGGAYLHNAELTFEWKSTVQVPTFDLVITKTADGAGKKVDQAQVVYSGKDLRGVSAAGAPEAAVSGDQKFYRYTLPRGVADITDEGYLFGNGAYTYTLTLKPYNGDATGEVELTGHFNLQLNASGDATFAETDGQATTFNAQDSYYIRAKVRYNGVVMGNDVLDSSRIYVEAHYSGSFNGNPVASTSDVMVYEDDVNNAEKAKWNPSVKMTKEKTDGAFFSTVFDVELRGLPTKDNVFLVAYLDLNGNKTRDAWEPWGYAMQGLKAAGGYYFDPMAITPQSSGTNVVADFYIWDMDTDNDKLADAWEWLQAKKPTTAFKPQGSGDKGWCDTFTGAFGDLTDTVAIWTKDGAGKLALTAYGAQLYGLTVEGEPDANGAVKVQGVADMEAAAELLSLLGDDVALDLLRQGIYSYGLKVSSFTNTGDAVTLTWEVTDAVGLDGATYDLTKIFATGGNTNATYSVYGVVSLGDPWTKLAEVQLTGAQVPSVELLVDDTKIDGTAAQFFKVILSATPLD